MVDWIVVIGFILLGIFLIVSEIIFIPGIFIAGSIGAGICIYAVYLSYGLFGSTTGTIILIATVLVTSYAVYFTLSGRFWERFSLKQTMSNKVNEENEFQPQIGSMGVTTSSLRPFGKAIFDNNILEVRSDGNYVSENVEIVVRKIEESKIIVEPIN